MKKVFVILSFAFVLCSCVDQGYSTINMTSVSDFEYDLELTTDVYGNQAFVDSLYLTNYFAGGSSSYGNLVFNSYRLATYSQMTGGFGITAKRDSSLVIKEDNSYPQYTMFATSAANNSNMSAVFYQNPASSLMPQHHILFLDSQYGTCAPAYFLINNTQKTVCDVLEEFEDGDWLKLTITGYNGTNETGTIEYYLVDFSEGNSTIVTNWETVNLASLGSIEYIDFELSSNRESFPNTFCIDNLVASIEVTY